MKLTANDLVIATDFLRIEIIQGHDYIALGQRKTIRMILDDLGVTEGRKVNIPCNASLDLSRSDDVAAESTLHNWRIVGTLLYIAMPTRPDISVCTSMLASNVEKPYMQHQIAAMKVSKYSNSTIDIRLV